MEQWRAIEGVAGSYEISNLGRVRNAATDKVLRCRPDKDGYRLVDVGGKCRKTLKLHRAVLVAFVGPPPFDGAEGDHRNGDKSNNKLSNLRWSDKGFNRSNLLHVTPRAASGVRGVRFKENRPSPWEAHGSRDGKWISLGCFITRDEAVEARRTYEQGRGIHG